ncbi:hypothetical protein [Treponema primitia]|uniref:hypothetical protein n=1 Tax=Treponema primitia TaxID=88058 RepID=UPI00031226E8|nr:hypothetical protein [Treponema primitia]
MQSIKTVLDSGKLENLIALPPDFRQKKVEVIIQLIPNESTSTENQQNLKSESFGMWEDRQDMEDVELFVRNLRKGRKLC